MEVDPSAAVAHGLAGGIAATVTLFLFFPIDIVRTQMQVTSGWRDAKKLSTQGPSPLATRVSGWSFAVHSYRQHGILGFYDGIGPSLTTQFISYTIYFVAYHALKSSWILSRPWSQQETLHLSTSASLLIAAASGILNVILTAPLWTAITRLKTQKWYASCAGAAMHATSAPGAKARKYSGLLRTMVYIARDEGVIALWSGTAASLVLVTNPMLQFAMYEQSKQLLHTYDVHLWVRALQDEVLGQVPFLTHTFGWNVPDLGTEMPGILYLGLGAWAKFFATMTTYPLQVVQSRLRAVRRDHTNAAGTIVSTLQGGNLYVGIETKLLQTVLTSAFMLLIYEKIVGTVASGIKLFMFLLYFLCNHI